jgi:SAM-dependent methyltransferase
MSKNPLSVLAEKEYLRMRLDPRPGDDLYLHLSDLRLAIETFRSDQELRILDFGCGGSPYRSLFPNSEYKRADIGGVDNIDYKIPTDGSSVKLPVDDGYFDLLLSSQVLEHVPNPDAYLSEAFRVLKPGGLLLISTHGVFEEHGCPYDFRRWTSFGLRLDLERSGFTLKNTLKLTTGCRAAVFLMQRHRAATSRKCSLGWWMWWLHWMQKNRRQSFNEQCDLAYADFRVVPDTEPYHGLYIGLLAAAYKPA